MTDFAGVSGYFSEHVAAFAAVTGLFGLVIGSFLNVVIHRLPIMLERTWRRHCEELLEAAPAKGDSEPYNLVTPGSRCPRCARPIRPHENIPVLSYLWLRARCAGCGMRISMRYPLVEIMTALLAATVAWRFGPQPVTAGALLLTFALIALSFIDLDRHILPDVITLPFLWLGLLANVGALFVPLSAAVIGAASGYVALWLVYHAFRLATGKEGLGYGDFKLLALAGAWLGFRLLPVVILLGSAAGAVVGLTLIALKRHAADRPMPFGPFLCAAIWLSLMWGDNMVRLYLRSF